MRFEWTNVVQLDVQQRDGRVARVPVGSVWHPTRDEDGGLVLVCREHRARWSFYADTDSRYFELLVN